jgi:hypothetical protein
MRRAFLALCVLVLSIPLFALGVDVDELKSGGQKVEFVNYAGPLTIFQTDLDIRGIGRTLADQVARGAARAAYLLKYSVIHIMGTTEPDKLGADLFSIDKDSQVDHIDNVRRIVSAYMERMYTYSRRDSDTLALFISYYNAVYRGNTTYFAGKYKKAVMDKVDPARVGISTKYYEWPGDTQMVIPLTEKPARDVLGTLNTSELTSRPVIDQLKEKEDLGVPERKAMTELKQKEVAQAEQKVAESAKKLQEEKAKTAAQDAALQERKTEAATLTGPQAKQAQEDIAARETQIARQKEEQKAQEATIEAQKQAVEEKKAEVAAESAEVKRDETAARIQQQPETVARQLEQKSEELDKREEEVVRREEAAKKGETDESIYAGLLYYLQIKEYLTGGHYNNEMYSINAATAQISQKSSVSNICGRQYDIFKEGVVVITHKGDHRAGHYLTLLDLRTLEPKITGTDAVFWRSFVEVKDDLIYAILNRDEIYYLAKFDLSMKTVAVSAEKVDPDTFISFFGDLVYVNRADKKIVALNKADLTTKTVIEP